MGGWKEFWQLKSFLMQRIVEVGWTVEQYAAGQLERTLSRPESCPCCGRANCLEAHGYYQRWVSGQQQPEQVVRIRVRRFFV